MEPIVRGVGLAQSLNANLKKPCIVIALHNTLFFHRGLFKGRSHPKSPCIYLSVLNNLISKSGFQNIAIRRELRMQWRSVYRKEINLTGTFGLFGALKCTTKWDIKPIFSSPRLHLISLKALMTTSARNNNKVILEKPNVPLFQRYINQRLQTHL